MERMEILEKYLLEDYKHEIRTSGLYKKTIPQVYWEELYTGRECDKYEDYYDYN